MMEAILKEAGLRKDYIDKNNEIVETIYFGGGTPSLCSGTDIQIIIEKVKELYQMDLRTEITLEANPDDISPEKLAAWKKAGINRLSIGVQSFAEEDLKWMNRIHTAKQAKKSIQLAQEYGFRNITIDLIYGTPTLTDRQWKRNVQTALALNIQHLSCYALTVEPRTALAKLIKLNKKENTDAEKQAHHFELLMKWMEKAGYEHYEISNFAKPGHRSKHNSSYWKGRTYLGLGPSAHSFNGTSRQWNVSNNALYLRSIENGVPAFEAEQLTAVQQLNEYIMTGLRTSEGISVMEMTKKITDPQKIIAVIKNAEKWIASGHMFIDPDSRYFKLTSQGKLLADGITADLFQI
jgi:oxygen-independent coproporphyrinogen-3 oxidase